MGKLMFGIVALAAGICVADIQSSNIVGYTTSSTVKDGSRTWGACFVNVGGNLTKMSDLKVTGYTRGEEEDFTGVVQLQCLDQYGRIEKVKSGDLKIYEWVDAAVDEDESGLIYFTGWKCAGEDASEDTINPGDGFWVFSDNDKWQIQAAGEVPVFKDGLVVTLNKDGSKMVANPTPASIKFKTVAVGGYTRGEEEDFSGVVQFQCLDQFGRVEKLESGDLKIYEWIDAAVDEDETGLIYFTGWKLAGEDAGEDTMDANEAFWTFSDSDKWTIVFPAIVL